MEKDKDSITLSSSDDSSNMSEVGHIIIHEDPLSPVESTASESKNDLSDNKSCTSTDTSAYDADTIIDSQTSISSTLQLNTPQDSIDISDEYEGISQVN